MRVRRQPKSPRRPTLVGSPSQKPQPMPAPDVPEVEDKPKKRTARKRAPKKEVTDE